MGVLWGSWLEAKALHRRLWPWLPAGLAVWLAFLLLQETQALRKAGVPLYWAGAEAGLLFALSFLPLVWILARRSMTVRWTLRTSLRPARSVVMPWLGLLLYGSAAALLFSLGSVTLYRIHGDLWIVEAGCLLLEAVLLLLPLAAIAPALAYLGIPAAALIVLWLGVLSGSLLYGFPVPTGSLLILQSRDLTMAPIGIEVVLSTALATTAGLALSLALARRRIAKVRHAHRNPG